MGVNRLNASCKGIDMEITSECISQVNVIDRNKEKKKERINNKETLLCGKDIFCKSLYLL